VVAVRVTTTPMLVVRVVAREVQRGITAGYELDVDAWSRHCRCLQAVVISSKMLSRFLVIDHCG
jgi:hypothetical protein